MQILSKNYKNMLFKAILSKNGDLSKHLRGKFLVKM